MQSLADFVIDSAQGLQSYADQLDSQLDAGIHEEDSVVFSK